jgi:hypothetical protein
MELKTYGDLKKVLKAIRMDQKGEKIVSQGKELGIDTLLSFFPGAGAAKTVLGFVQAAVKKPDTKKSNTWLDRLDVDDKVSQIVDDTIENQFMAAMAKKIEQEADDTELSDDFNMNTELQQWLADTYDKRTVSYVKEQMVRSYVRKTIKEVLLNGKSKRRFGYLH